jgi:hypothetical protein
MNITVDNSKFDPTIHAKRLREKMYNKFKILIYIPYMAILMKLLVDLVKNKKISYKEYFTKIYSFLYS